jgi:cell wall-associated NlpC family hydrolase
MNTYAKVQQMLTSWREQKLSKAEIVVRLAKACLGWPYVWGAYGQQCTPSVRRAYAARSACPSGESELIIKQCQVCNGSKSSCEGCRFYPGGPVLCFDCRGFTRWVLARVGISLNGAGATSQWNDAKNWVSKGAAKDTPKDEVCCEFMKQGTKMSHTGLSIGNGEIIHCSGTVKEGKVTDRGWTNYAIPVGLEGEILVWRSTIRKGSRGEDVKYCQEILMKLGYDIGKSGVDGIFGTATKNAVVAFQRAVGLNPDGVVGTLTWQALESVEEPSEPVVKTYKVCISNLTKEQADELHREYPESTIEEE